jgi:hypothetical protein
MDNEPDTAAALTPWDESVWAILNDATVAERQELERVRATEQYRRVVEWGIPSDSLDVALVWSIRSTAVKALLGAGTDFGAAAAKLREAASALDPLALLPKVFPGYEEKTDTLRTFEPFKLLGDPAQLRDGLIHLANQYDRIAAWLRDAGKDGGRPVNLGRRIFIGALDVAAAGLVGEPLIPLLHALDRMLFPDSPIDIETYRREVKRSRKRRRLVKRGDKTPLPKC